MRLAHIFIDRPIFATVLSVFGPRDPAEVARQAPKQFDGEFAELATEQRGLEKELAWHHADIRKISKTG